MNRPVNDRRKSKKVKVELGVEAINGAARQARLSQSRWLRPPRKGQVQATEGARMGGAYFVIK